MSKVRPSEDGMILLDFLAGELDLSKRKAKNLLDSKRVFVNRAPVWMARHKLRAGDTVETTGGTAPRSAAAVRILFQDANYLVADKPSGLLSNGGNSLEAQLRQTRNEPGLLAVHRLDRDTTGCLLFARSREAFDAAVAEFKAHRVRKTYHALVAGRFNVSRFRINRPIDGQRAETVVQTLDSNQEASHVSASIETGRTHQIRRHLALMGHPVLGDLQYGARMPASDKMMKIPRQMLHAAGIELTDPATCRRITAGAPLPPDFRNCLRLYRLA